MSADATPRWHDAYERAAVDAFLADAGAEIERLDNAIAELEARRAEATERRESRLQEAALELGELVSDAQREITALEREHDERVALLRAETTVRVQAILGGGSTEAIGDPRGRAGVTRIEPATTVRDSS